MRDIALFETLFRPFGTPWMANVPHLLRNPVADPLVAGVGQAADRAGLVLLVALLAGQVAGLALHWWGESAQFTVHHKIMFIFKFVI